jgi:hypothetical protein
LHQNGRAAEDQSFRESKLNNAQQNEKKVDRHRAGDAWEINLETGGEQRHYEVEKKLYWVAAGSVQGSVGEN